MKKSIVWIMIAVVIALFVLIACGAINDDDQNTDADNGDKSVVTTDPGEDADSNAAEEISYVRQTDNSVQESVINGCYRTGNSQYIEESIINKYKKLTNLPCLYITLDNHKSIGDITHGSYISGTYTLVDDHVIESYYELPLQIKGRGNWSWSFAQKPYNIKLGSKADLLGMGSAKKWVLVTVHSDKTMMHNFMTQKLAKIMGLRGTCDNEYVDVVVNGSYIGTYVLTEKIQIHENRVNLVNDQGILYEIEMVYRHSCKRCVVLYDNPSDRSRSIHLELKQYKDWDMDNLTRAQTVILRDKLTQMQEYFDLLATSMQSGDWETLTRMIDVDSFVNWYLLNELTRNYDSAFVTSCYCFINEDNKVYMGPVWDFDTCYGAQDGTYNNQHIQDAPWFGWLFKNCKEFVELVKIRWGELRVKDGIIADFYHAIDDIKEYIAESEVMEHKLYPDAELLNHLNFEQSVDYFKTWLKNRIQWMDKEFLPPEHDELDQDTTITTTTVTTPKRTRTPSRNDTPVTNP